MEFGVMRKYFGLFRYVFHGTDGDRCISNVH